MTHPAPTPAAPSRIFGFAPSPLTAPQIAAAMAAGPRPRSQGVGLVVTANIDHIAHLRHNAAFAAAYASAAIITCDGFPVMRYARLRGCTAAGRVTGCDITASLLRDIVPGPSHALFFVADGAETASSLRDWARRHGLAARTRIAIAPPGFQTQTAQQSLLADQIRDHGTTILLMGIGAPRSEIFVNTFRHRLPPCWAACVGQALRIEMGLVPRAPAAWQNRNLEWLWRLALEPRRLSARYATAAMGFLLAVAAEHRRDAVPRVLLAATLASLAACQPPVGTAAPGPLAAVDATPPYRLHAGDEVEVLFTDTPELNLRQTIRNDGSLPMPMAGDVPASGLTVPALHDALVARYARQLVRPDLTVVLRTASGDRVFVGGEVIQQGAQPLDAPLTASRAIILAQGLKPTADTSQVLVIHTSATGATETHTVDIGRVLAGEPRAEDPALQPFDVVFVPDAPIAKLDRFVDQYIRQLLPTTPTMLYQINPISPVHQ